MKEDSTLNTNYPRGTWTSLNEHIYKRIHIYLTGPIKQTILSRNNLENMSYALSPLP